MIQRLDNLIHHPRLHWVPRILTKLGMTWAEIRRARHGKVPGYSNQFDMRLSTDPMIRTTSSTDARFIIS